MASGDLPSSVSAALLAVALACEGCAAQPAGLRGIAAPMPADATPAQTEAATPLPMPPPPPPKPAAEGSDKNKKGSDRSARTIGWVLVSVGAEAALVAFPTSIVLVNDVSARSDNCNAQKVCSAGGFGANAQIESLKWWNAGAWVLAAVGVGVGTYLVLANPPRKSAASLEPGRDLKVGVATIGTGTGLSLEGSF
jgi:hypothetical protein